MGLTSTRSVGAKAWNLIAVGITRGQALVVPDRPPFGFEIRRELYDQLAVKLGVAEENVHHALFVIDRTVDRSGENTQIPRL